MPPNTLVRKTQSKFKTSLLVIVSFDRRIEILLDQLHRMDQLAHVFGQYLVSHFDLLKYLNGHERFLIKHKNEFECYLVYKRFRTVLM